MKSKIIILIVFLAVFELSASQYVKFEGGRELEIESYIETDEWINFQLIGGGTLGVRKERVTVIGETEKDRIFLVSNKSVVTSRETAEKSTVPESKPSGEERKTIKQSSSGQLGVPLIPGGADSTPENDGKASDGSGENKSNGKETSEGIEERKEGRENKSPADIAVMPASVNTPVGKEFLLTVAVSSVIDLSHASFYLVYDPQMLEILSVNDGGFLSLDGVNSIFLFKIKPESGQVIVGISRKGVDIPGISGSGLLASFTARGLKSGNTQTSLANLSLKTSDMNSIPYSQTTASINISE